MECLKNKLLLCGANIEQVMDRFLNDEEFYVECLQSFFDDKESLVSLKKYLDAQNLEAAFEVTHMVKGVSANLGLMNFNEKICNIVEALRHKEAANYDALYADIEEQYTKLSEIFGM